MAQGEPGFLAKIKRGLFMTHTEILERLDNAARQGLGRDAEVLEALEEALVSADIGPATAISLVEAVARRAGRYRREDLPELRRMLREEVETLLLSVPGERVAPGGPPQVVFLVGVNGTGKTTSAAKLAGRDARAGRSVLLCAADTFRAAAGEQLEIWADRLGVPLVRHREGADPAAVLHDALEAARARRSDVVYVDTAGRLHTKANLMEELAKMRRVASRLVPGAPHRSLLVLDATTGANALAQAKRFVEAAGVTGVVLTKLDGTARGGVVLGIVRELALPVVEIGVGESADDLVPFDARTFARALFD